MASEHQQRSLAQELTGGLTGECALFSFADKRRREVFHKVAFVWVEDLEQDMLDHNDRFECTSHITYMHTSCTLLHV